jgi:hypothetical protein
MIYWLKFPYHAATDASSALISSLRKAAPVAQQRNGELFYGSPLNLPEEVVDRMCVPLAYREIEPLLLRFLAFHHLSEEHMNS